MSGRTRLDDGLGRHKHRHQGVHDGGRPKQASIWVAYSRGADSHLLTGQYESQGNNVLSTCWSWIAATARKSEIATTVDEHLAKVDHAIGETYAVRLLKHCTPRSGA